jgi:hypothetical protein
MKNYHCLIISILLFAASCAVQTKNSTKTIYNNIKQTTANLGRVKDATPIPTEVDWIADRKALDVQMAAIIANYEMIKNKNKNGSIAGITIGGITGLTGGIISVIPETKSWWVSIPALVATAVSSLTGGLNIQGVTDKALTCIDIIHTKIAVFDNEYSDLSIRVAVNANDAQKYAAYMNDRKDIITSLANAKCWGSN